jgi:hypothetical protein
MNVPQKLYTTHNTTHTHTHYLSLSDIIDIKKKAYIHMVTKTKPCIKHYAKHMMMTLSSIFVLKHI